MCVLRKCFISTICVRIKLTFSISDSTQGQTSEAQHKAECKGLILQINFVKAKWAREFNLRGSLVFQKNYLLDLLAKREKR